MRAFIAFIVVLLLATVAYFVLGRARRSLPAPPGAPPSAELVPAPAPRLAVPGARADGGADAVGVTPADEATILRKIRDNVRSNPQLAETLAREARARFGDSAEADERDALLVDALINQQRIGAARSETYYYLDHHPNGRFAEHLFVMTGVHPQPKPPAAH